MRTKNDVQTQIDGMNTALKDVRGRMKSLRQDINRNARKRVDNKANFLRVAELEAEDTALQGIITELKTELGEIVAWEKSPEYKAEMKRAKGLMLEVDAAAVDLLKGVDALLIKAEQARGKYAEVRAIDKAGYDVPLFGVQRSSAVVCGVGNQLRGVASMFQTVAPDLAKKAKMKERRVGFRR